MMQENQRDNHLAEEALVDVRAREVEQQMTDDERFSLLVSVMGTNPVRCTKQV